MAECLLFACKVAAVAAGLMFLVPFLVYRSSRWAAQAFFEAKSAYDRGDLQRRGK